MQEQVWTCESPKFVFEKQSKWGLKGGAAAVPPLKPMLLPSYHRYPVMGGWLRVQPRP